MEGEEGKEVGEEEGEEEVGRWKGRRGRRWGKSRGKRIGSRGEGIGGHSRGGWIVVRRVDRETKGNGHVDRDDDRRGEW